MRAGRSALQESVRGRVNAEAQALLVERLLKGDWLTQEERGVLRWGRNAAVSAPRRLKGREGLNQYRNASALEVLCGYLFVSEPVRLQGLMHQLDLAPPPAPEP